MKDDLGEKPEAKHQLKIQYKPYWGNLSQNSKKWPKIIIKQNKAK